MADTYPHFAVLERSRRAGIDDAIACERGICNRGTAGVGVQLELSRAMRETLFDSPTRKGRQRPTARVEVFVGAVAGALEQA